MTDPHNSYPVAQETHPDQATILETNLDQWHQRMEDVMAQGARIIAFRGAGSANGIEPSAAMQIGEMLHRYVTGLTAEGTPVVLMYDGDDDVREQPDLGSVFGALAEDLADNASVTAIAVQTTGWYKPKSEGAALASAGGRAYETYVFNKDMPEINPSLKGRGLAHSALTQSAALVAYDNYEQIIVGAAGSITAGQLHDLAQKTGGRPVEAGPVRVSILSAHINPELDESLQDSAQNDPREDRRARAAEKIIQRANHPYGALFTAAGECALVAADYPGVEFQPTIDDELLDLVDKNDNVTGTIWRSKTSSLGDTKAGFIRAATALIQNDNGDVWIPRRTADKRIAPNGLDSSMQEHMGSGESYLEATIRGFKEELNLDVTEDQLEYIGTVPPDDELYYFVALYVYKTNDVPKYNPKDFVGYEWINPEVLVSRLENGEPSTKSLLSTVKKLFLKNL